MTIVNDGGEGVPKPTIALLETPFPDWIIEELKRQGHRTPTALQAQAWPTAMIGRDMVCIAETGSGKTLVYPLPLAVKAYSTKSVYGPPGVVLVATRRRPKSSAC